MATQAATTGRRGKVKTYEPAVDPDSDPSADAQQRTTAAFIETPTRDEMIARAAYFRAERRGFGDGCALQDWLEAEAEVDARPSR